MAMMKKLSAIAAFLLLLVGILLTVTACGGSVKEISVDTAHMPQVVFVEGNELDLSAGSLIVDGKAVSYTADGVEVIGFDKNKCGEQTLTISYKGKSTELKVTVVPRVQTAEPYLYFVGETIDAAGLRLRFTRDDGSSFTVAQGTEGLVIENFNTDTPNNALTLTAIYTENGTEYRGSFEVAVVSPQISFKKPRKTAYGSHETNLDLTGASLTLKNEDGKTTRNISITELTTSGFDPSVANAGTPALTQTITVYYLGREMGTFEISVTYSNVSKLHDTATELAALDWSHYEYPDEETHRMYLPEGTTEDMCRSAIEGLRMYYGLNASDMELIEQSELEAIARVAVIYGYNEWQEALNNMYADAFAIDVADSGEQLYTVYYTCSTVDAAREGVRKLKDASDPETQLILDYSRLLKDEKLLSKCGDLVIYLGAEMDGESVGLTVGHLLSIIAEPSFYQKVAGVLEKAVAIYDGLNVPDGWRADELSQYATVIDAAYTDMVTLSRGSAADTTIFEMMNSWRSDRGVFEILYRYYYGVFTTADAASAEEASKRIDQLTELCLPAELNALNEDFYYALTAQTTLVSIADSLGSTEDFSGYFEMPESTIFLYFYRNVLRGIDHIYEMNDPLYLELCSRVYGDYLLYFETGDFGYFALHDTSALDDAYLAVWEQYLDIFGKMDKDDEYADSADFDKEVEAMFTDFVNLMPRQQYNFIKSLNYLYETYGIPNPALCPTEEGYLYTQFANVVYYRYCELLGVDLESEKEDIGYDLFTDLMLALEAYANNDINTFGECMDSVIAAYRDWSGTEKQAFDEHLKFFYDRYVSLFEMYEKTTDDEGNVSYVFRTIALDEKYQQLFDQIANELMRASIGQLFIEQGDQFFGQPMTIYLAYIATYENIRFMVEQIEASGDAELIRAYRYQPYGGVGGVSLADGVYDAYGTYQKYLMYLQLDDGTYEEKQGLRDFLRKYVDYFWHSVVVGLSGGMETDIIENGYKLDLDKVGEMTADFRHLNLDEQYLFVALDASNLYYSGLQDFLTRAYGGDSKLTQTSVALMTVEIMYITYQQYPDGVTEDEYGNPITVKELLLDTWNTLSQEGYQQLPYDEKAIFEGCFGEMYRYYQQVCAEIEDAD